ncbi:ribosomal protein L22 [Saccharata proteae CBS 121410]|uniref:Ribosomal protein L22 n=1 Tax=Saccharata proteae CBS 121410 TaxID=1314787 RepID=A0A9P4I4W1_9PEZI|nr:ribosomal protein L22 [Saccharata proteae CBS 121410]
MGQAAVDTKNNPFLSKFLENRGVPKDPQEAKLQRPAPGDLGPNSPFAHLPSPSKHGQGSKNRGARQTTSMALALDPDPLARKRFERRKVIREIEKRGRLTKTQKLKRTERECLAKSQMIKTSVKKLTMLARQIQGKPIDEAIVQMRFSPKKAAQSVKEHLEYARDLAIVSRGMGLGAAQNTKGEPTEIELKDGKRRTVTDRTGIYIDQAWVGRGTYGVGYDYRARGRVNMLRLPKTSISVLLKEEATRIRLSEEMHKKRDNRKVWVHLPDRPIQQQSQYNLW